MASRAYDSPVRREKARETERRILAATRDLLLAEGWGGTAMTAIAARAGVSAQLLYKMFGTKAALAKRLWDVALVGDDEPVPLNERPEIAAIIAEPDPRRKIALYARLAREVSERLGPLSARLRGAAAAGDADLAALMATTDRERLTGNAGIVRHLASLDVLRPGVTVDRGIDMVWTLLSPEMFHRLTVERGWSYDEAQEWLADQVGAALLGK